MLKKGIRVRCTMQGSAHYGEIGVVDCDSRPGVTGEEGGLVKFEDGVTLILGARDFEFENRTEEFLNWLPEKFVNAHRRKKSARWWDDMMWNEWFPSFDDDRQEDFEEDGETNPWIKVCTNPGFRTENGILYGLLLSQEEDGGMEADDEHPVEAEDYLDWEKKVFNPEEIENAWKEYFKWVAKNAYDPLNELYVEKTKDVNFKFTVLKTEKGLKFVNVMNLSTYQVFKAEDEIPTEVSNFLCLERIEGEEGWYVAPSHFSVDELFKASNVKWHRDVDSPMNVGEFTTKVDLTDAEYREILVKNATERSED